MYVTYCVGDSVDGGEVVHIICQVAFQLNHAHIWKLRHRKVSVLLVKEVLAPVPTYAKVHL